MSVTSTSSLKRCAYPACNNENSELKRCTRCQTALYCGQPHQKAHWPTHRSVCTAPVSSAVSATAHAAVAAGITTSSNSSSSSGSLSTVSSSSISSSTPSTSSSVSSSSSASISSEEKGTCRFAPCYLDATYKEMLGHCPPTALVAKETAFGPIPVYIAFNAPYFGGGTILADPKFVAHINAIVDNTGFSDRALYNTYRDSNTSPLHKQYAAFALYLRHNPSVRNAPMRAPQGLPMQRHVI